MEAFRKRLEEWFADFSNTIYDNPWKTLLLTFLVIAGLAIKLPDIAVNTSLEGLLHETDPTLMEYNRFRDQFGREELIIVAVKTQDVFDMKFLERLKTLHDDLDQNVPLTEKITSLINARNTYGQNDELHVKDLFEEWPKTDAELLKIKERVLQTPMYLNTLISKDLTFATILIQTRKNSLSDKKNYDMTGFDIKTDTDVTVPAGNKPPAAYLTDEENSDIVKSVNAIARKYDTPDFKIFVAGSPSVTHSLKVSLFRDMTLFSIISTTAICLFLYLMFRRISGVFMPLIIVYLSLIFTLCIMAITGAVIKIPFVIVPSFLLTVGVGDVVHILAFFYVDFNNTGNKKKSIASAVSHSVIAVIFTSATTAGGLLSFITAEIAPVADLGVYAAAGVMVAFLFTFLLLPALIAIIPLKPKKNIEPKNENTKMMDVLKNISFFSIRRPISIILLGCLVLTISFFFMTKIRFFHNVVEWFPEKDPIRMATETIDRELKGSISLEVVVDTKKENGIYDPVFLKKLDNIGKELETFHEGDMFVGKAWSITTIVKEINRALNNNQKEFYTLPETRDLVAQELLLFENSGSDDLLDFTDSQFSKARVVIKVPAIDAIQYSEFISRVSEQFHHEFPDCDVSVTGMMAILFSTIQKLIISMAKSYIVEFLTITFLMILFIGDLWAGLLSMVPNLVPIIIMLGIMGWLRIPMDMFSVLVGNIVAGIIVDDTIHFMHTFRRNLKILGDSRKATMQTVIVAGRAMVITSLVLSAGFFTYMFSSMSNLYYFGLLSGITMLIALVSELLLTPALMVLVYRKK